MKCPNCNKENSKDTLYCVECGASLKNSDNDDKFKIVIICTVIIVALLIISTTFIIIANQNSQNNSISPNTNNQTSTVSTDSDNSASNSNNVYHTYAAADDGSNPNGQSYSTYLDSSGNERIVGYDYVLEPDRDGDGIRYFYYPDGSQTGVQA